MAEGLRKRRTRMWHSERGAELVEFAMVMPVLIVIFAGIVDFGLMLQRFEVLTNAAREGARLRVLPGYGDDDARLRVEAYLDEGLSAGASGNSETDVLMTTVAAATGPPIQAAQVVVTYTTSYAILGPVMSLIGGSDFGEITLTSRATMRMEVPAP